MPKMDSRRVPFVSGLSDVPHGGSPRRRRLSDALASFEEAVQDRQRRVKRRMHHATRIVEGTRAADELVGEDA